MDVVTNVSLKKYTTMQLGGEARFMAQADSVDDVVSLYRNARKQNLRVFVLGGGSNLIAHDEPFDGIILLNRIKGFEVVDDDINEVTVKIGAGELWDNVVKRAVDMGLQGIEAMSGIPGTAGAAPVQNIGAYGQEVADTLVSLEAYDTKNDALVNISSEECQFSYRSSVFREGQRGRYCIVSITLRLYRSNPKPPYYAALQRYFDEHMMKSVSLQDCRNAVLTIRADKLPNPDKFPNAGSFFKNAMIDTWHRDELLKKYPDMPHYAMSDGTHKIPSGWLIEKAGLKGKKLFGMRVYEKNALVLVNDEAAGYKDLSAARDEIVQTVYDMFHIQLQQEPLELE